MVVTVMKTTYQKLEPETISEGDYEYYSNERFRERIISELTIYIEITTKRTTSENRIIVFPLLGKRKTTTTEI